MIATIGTKLITWPVTLVVDWTPGLVISTGKPIITVAPVESIAAPVVMKGIVTAEIAVVPIDSVAIDGDSELFGVVVAIGGDWPCKDNFLCF